MFRIFLLHVIVWFACGTAILLTVHGNEDYSCVLPYVSWLHPENLTVNWTLPDGINNNDVKANISWYTDRNEGTCGESTLTACTWYHGYNGVNFNMPFFLNIIIRDRTDDSLVWNTTFNIDPLVSCTKPPEVDLFTVSSVNSTCVDVRWEYTNLTDCSVIDTKQYRISYYQTGTTSDDKAMRHADFFEKSTISCEDSEYVCDLRPFTTYTFAIQAKFIDFGTTGHLSDQVMRIMKTHEQAPDDSPGLTDGSWSYDYQECTRKNERVVRLFWKDVPNDKKYGDITNFKVSVSDQDGMVDYSFPGHRFTGIVTVKCDRTYMITMAAENNAGISPLSDTIIVYPFVSHQLNSIERVIPESSENTFRVFWHPRDAAKNYTVLWCLKDTEHHCQSSVNWTAASNDADFITIPWQPDKLPHMYAIAVATEEDGATWADCLYVDTEIPAPKNVVLKKDESLLDGSMVVSWYNLPCSEVGPYIDVFHIYMCQVKSEERTDCLNPVSTIIVDGRRGLRVFHNLEPGIMYKVKMRAIGLHNRTSTFSKTAFGRATLHESILSPGITALIVIVGLVLITFAGYAMYQLTKRLCQRWKQFKQRNEGIKIPEYSYTGVHTENTV